MDGDKSNVQTQAYEAPTGAHPGYPPPYSQGTPGVADAQYVHPPIVVHQQPAAVTVQTVPAVGIVPFSTNVGPKPSNVMCRSCQAYVTTSVRYTNSSKTHIIALILCVFALWPCACIPYCVDSCKNADHYCPNCNAYIGQYYS